MTEHPTAAWTAQQILQAFSWDTAPRYLLRDRDSIYGDALLIQDGADIMWMDAIHDERQYARLFPSRADQPYSGQARERLRLLGRRNEHQA